MPCAHTIQCLEAKDTNPADVYTYWLAIVAHLQDLITKDDALKEKSRYLVELKEKICAIANYQSSQLIENERASNVYLTVFVLDPGMIPMFPTSSSSSDHITIRKLSSTNSHQPKPSCNSLHKSNETEQKPLCQTKG